MLRKGIVALMITVMSVSSLTAADGKRSTTLMDFIRGPGIGRPNHQQTRKPARPGGVTHAVVADVEKQVPEIRQTSSEPEKPQLQPAESTPQPLPVQYASAPTGLPTAVAPQPVSPQTGVAPQAVPAAGAWQSYSTPPVVVMAPGSPFHFASAQQAMGGGVPMASGGGGMITGGSSPGGLCPTPSGTCTRALASGSICVSPTAMSASPRSAGPWVRKVWPRILALPMLTSARPTTRR